MTTATLEWTFNDRLRKLRSVTGLSQDAFAELIGAAPGSYPAWERTGHPRNMVAMSQQIEERLDCPGVAAWLLGLGPTPPNSGALTLKYGCIYEAPPNLFDFMADPAELEGRES